MGLRVTRCFSKFSSTELVLVMCVMVFEVRERGLPLSNQVHRSFCEEVWRPPRYLYSSMGVSSCSSSLYFSDALLVDVWVESVKPVLSLRSSDAVSIAGVSMVGSTIARLSSSAGAIESLDLQAAFADVGWRICDDGVCCLSVCVDGA